MKVRVIPPAKWVKGHKFVTRENQDRMLAAFAAAYMGDRTVDVIVMRTTAAWGTFAERDTALDHLNRVMASNGESDDVVDYYAGNWQSLDTWLTHQSDDGLEFEGELWKAYRVRGGVAYRFHRQ